ncbi:hypothetical protein ACFXKR_36135 [Streptomyces violascens]|uniref:hypothetical protein n=1 Tax=Streptomyces violascens TaxID=67381 RepID=UPI0036C1FF72
MPKADRRTVLVALLGLMAAANALSVLTSDFVELLVSRFRVQRHDLRERFGPWITVYERHRLWSADGVLWPTSNTANGVVESMW